MSKFVNIVHILILELNLPESIILGQENQFQVYSIFIISMFDLLQVPNFIKIGPHFSFGSRSSITINIFIISMFDLF